MIRLVLLLVLGLATAAAAQPQVTTRASMTGLPHHIPDLCATDPTATLVPAGTTRTLSGTVTATCLGVHGALTLADQTDLTVGTLLVYPDGRLTIGPRARVSFTGTLDLTVDPEQFGIGLIGLGTIRIAGRPVTPTWTRLTVEPRAGATTLTLDTAPTGWQAGDRLILPDSRHLKWNETGRRYIYQGEVLTIASLAGPVITLTAPLAFDHPGARDGDGHLDFLPHVGLLSRAVVVTTAPGSPVRGHVLLADRADVEIRFAAFHGIGRTTNAPLDSTTRDATGTVTHVGTNQIGRYPLHAHFLFGPLGRPATTPQFSLVGNAVEESLKWGIAIHGSSYGLIQDNVLYQIAGSHVVTEDGAESFNVFAHNFAVRGWGTGGRTGNGREGVGFWFRGPNNYVRDNVAANYLSDGPDAGYGFKYFQPYLGNIRVPNFPGADTSVAGNYTTISAHTLPLLEFARNEVYGATESGLAHWWLGTYDEVAPKSTVYSVVKDFHIWHVYNRGIFAYPHNKVLTEDLVIRGIPEGSACCSQGIVWGDYYAQDVILRRANIQGVWTAIDNPTLPTVRNATTPGITRIEDSYFRSWTGMQSPVLLSTNGNWNLGPRKTIISNSRFEPWPPDSARRVWKVFYAKPVTTSGNLIQSDVLEFVDYQGVKGESFQQFRPEQAPGAILPQTVYRADGKPQIVGAPVAGLTNTEAHATYGIAFGGAIATCSLLRPELDGFSCPADPCVADPLTVTANYPLVAVTATDTRGCTVTQ